MLLLCKWDAKAFLQQSTGPSLIHVAQVDLKLRIAKDNLELLSKVNSIFQELGVRT